jgi:hypothetical protein
MVAADLASFGLSRTGSELLPMESIQDPALVAPWKDTHKRHTHTQILIVIASMSSCFHGP